MPQIKTFDAIGDLRPTNVGVDATAAAARRGNAFYDDAAQSMQALGRLTREAGSDVAQAGRATAEAVRAGAESQRASADALRAAGGAVKTVGDVATDYIAHREISTGSANFAAMQEATISEWNSRVKTADVNDPSVAAQFREEVLQPRLEEFQKGFLTTKGENWAQSHAVAFQQHMFQKQSADMSTMAGIALKTNMETTINRLSSTVRQDPSSLDFAIGTAKSSIAAMADTSPTLTPAAAAEAKSALTLHAQETIVKSWFLGVAEKNPDEAVKALESGKYADFIKGPEAKQIISYARTNQRLMNSEARTARLMQEHNDKLQFHSAANNLELSTIPEKVGDKPTLPGDYWQNVRKLGEMPGAVQEPGRLNTMVRQGEIITDRLNKPEPLGRVSHETTVQLLSDIRENKITDVKPIYEAFGRGELNNADFNFLMKGFTDMRSPEGQRWGQGESELIKAVKPAIDKSNPLMGKIDQDGPMNLYRFQMDLNKKKAEFIKAGKDPHALLDPASPDFFGKPESLQQYQKPLQQSIRDQATRLRGGSTNLSAPGTTITGVQTTNIPAGVNPNRQPGETPDAYLKRIGVK